MFATERATATAARKASTRITRRARPERATCAQRGSTGQMDSLWPSQTASTVTRVVTTAPRVRVKHTRACSVLPARVIHFERRPRSLPAKFAHQANMHVIQVVLTAPHAPPASSRRKTAPPSARTACRVIGVSKARHPPRRSQLNARQKRAAHGEAPRGVSVLKIKARPVASGISQTTPDLASSARPGPP